jgi:iron complex outermembrane receptor protein
MMGNLARRKPNGQWKTGLSILVACLPLAGHAADDPLFDLNLTEVLSLEITSVSKKPQTVSRAAAAVFVITADDIRRSGATAVPELLRMVPGVQVGQISASTWAVSSRGLDGRFTNKLLVLMDGRSVYSPTFSGVYWDVQDTVLEDIERVEVIRGPGATLWGANAVNGVINIITKSAASTQGGLLSVRAGKEERGAATFRYGGELGAMGHWRAYVKGFDRDASVAADSGRAAGDAWHQTRTGFRADLTPTGGDAMTVQGDYYSGRAGESTNLNFVVPPYNAVTQPTSNVSGGNLLLRWQRELSATDSFTLQTYADHTERDWPVHFKENRSTYDLDFQYRSRRFRAHDLVAGFGYRYSHDVITPSMASAPATALPIGLVNPASTGRKLVSAFVQDDITLVPEKVIFTVGGKLEKNDYTGVEFQPNLRLLWMPAESTSVWGSVARAARTPSRVDRGGVINFLVERPSAAVPAPVLIQGGGLAESEYLVAYETGVKHRFSGNLSGDLSVFYNDYEKLRTGRLLAPVCMPSGAALPFCLFLPGQTYLLQFTQAGNEARGWSHGAELSLDWRPVSNLRFQAALSQYRMTIREDGNAFSTDREGSAPEVQGSLRMAWNPRHDTDVDLWLRRVGRLSDVGYSFSIPAYTELDARLAWRPRKNLEVALIGHNLLHKQHAEFKSESQDVPLLLMQRTVSAQLTVNF